MHEGRIPTTSNNTLSKIEQVKAILATFSEEVQTAKVISDALDMNPSTLTDAHNKGRLGGASYEAGFNILIHTQHPDLLEFLIAHFYHPRHRGGRRKKEVNGESLHILNEAIAQWQDCQKQQPAREVFMLYQQTCLERHIRPVTERTFYRHVQKQEKKR